MRLADLYKLKYLRASRTFVGNHKNRLPPIWSNRELYIYQLGHAPSTALITKNAPTMNSYSVNVTVQIRIGSSVDPVRPAHYWRKRAMACARAAKHALHTAPNNPKNTRTTWPLPYAHTEKFNILLPSKQSCRR